MDAQLLWSHFHVGTMHFAGTEVIIICRAHTCVVMEDGAIHIQAAVVTQELNGPALEAIVVGEVAVQDRDAGCVGKDCSGCRLCVAHKSDILKCYVAVLQND